MSTATKSPAKSESPTHSPASARAHSPAKSSAVAGPGGLAYVQQSAGNLAIQQLLNAGAIKAELTISQPNDPDEQEADAVADRIMRMEDPGPISSSSGVIHRTCAACDTGGALCASCAEEKNIQRKESPGAVAQPSASQHSQIAGLRGGGEPLTPSVRAFFEPRFSHDFSNVRVHTDSGAARSSRQIGAFAFTLGSDIAFAAGEFSPDSASGRRLLAHELVHVAQQERKSVPDAIQRYCDPTIQSCLPGTERPLSSISARYSLAEAVRPMPPIGPIYHFEGVALAQDTDFMYQQLTLLVLDLGDAGAASSFAERLRNLSHANIESERRRTEDYEREGTLPGGVPLPADVLAEEEMVLANKDRLQPFVDAAAERIDLENQVIAHQIDTMARANLSEAIRISEERVLSERERYGLTPARTEYRATMGDYGEHTFEISSYRPASMDSNTATAGLASAARRLVGEVHAIRALVVERNSLILTHCTETDCDTTITDPARYERVNLALEEHRYRYAVVRNEAEADYPILAAYTTIESDAYVDIDHVIDNLNTMASGQSPSVASMLYRETEDKLNNIRLVREALREGNLSVWEIPSIIALTRDQLSIRDRTRMGSVLQWQILASAQRTQSRAFVNLAIGLVALALGLLAAIPSGGSSLVAAGTFTAAVGAAGVSAYMAVTHVQEYMLQSAMNGTDFDKARAISQEDPSLFWVALDVVGAIADLHGAMSAFRALRGTVRAAMEARQAGNVAEAEQQIRQLIVEADSRAPQRNLGRRLANHIAEETGHMRTPDLMEWQRGLNAESRAFLVDNPTTRVAYESMSPTVRQILTNCASLCVIPNLTRAQIYEVQQVLDRLMETGASLNDNVMIQLKIYFHIQQEDFPRALRMLRGVNTIDDLERQVLQGFRRRAMRPLGTIPTATPRDITGTVTGGLRLELVRAGEPWLHASTRGRIGLIPDQIAQQLRGQQFDNFNEFRVAFWQAVENDPVLSSGFNESNRALMRTGQAPFGPGGQYQLHHITPLENGGALYDLDNLMVVVEEFHSSIHSTVPLQ